MFGLHDALHPEDHGPRRRQLGRSHRCTTSDLGQRHAVFPPRTDRSDDWSTRACHNRGGWARRSRHRGLRSLAPSDQSGGRMPERHPRDVWAVADAYERYIGRWSRLSQPTSIASLTCPRARAGSRRSRTCSAAPDLPPSSLGGSTLADDVRRLRRLLAAVPRWPGPAPA